MGDWVSTLGEIITIIQLSFGGLLPLATFCLFIILAIKLARTKKF